MGADIDGYSHVEINAASLQRPRRQLVCGYLFSKNSREIHQLCIGYNVYLKDHMQYIITLEHCSCHEILHVDHPANSLWQTLPINVLPDQTPER